jgi:hypothetical protein
MMRRGSLIIGCFMGLGLGALGCGDDSTSGQADAGAGVDLQGRCSSGVNCCPLPEDPISGIPTGSCSVEGSYCQPDVSDTSCTCTSGSWQCRSALSLDMARHD